MPWGLLAGLALNFLGGQQARSQADRASAISDRQEQRLQQLQDYSLGRRQKVFDPLLDNIIIPRLVSRAQSAPFFAAPALRFAHSLNQPLTLPRRRGFWTAPTY